MIRAIVIALRLVLGAIFVYAAWTKLKQPSMLFALSIDAYGLLPEWAVVSVARALPWAELLIGALLLTGLWLRWVSAAATAVLAVFFAIMLLSFGKGMGIDCGCFGVGEALTWKTLVRDGSLLAAALVLCLLAIRQSRPKERLIPA